LSDGASNGGGVKNLPTRLRMALLEDGLDRAADGGDRAFGPAMAFGVYGVCTISRPASLRGLVGGRSLQYRVLGSSFGEGEPKTTAATARLGRSPLPRQSW